MNDHILRLLSRGNKIRLGPLMHEKGVPIPCYPDIRAIYSRPPYLRTLVTELAMRIENERIDVFAGASSGGLPLAVALAMTMNRPFLAVRLYDKNPLDRPLIEGVWRKGQRVAIVDDSLVLGRQKKRVFEILVEAQLRPTHVLTVMEVGGAPAWSEHRKWLQEKGIKVLSLVTWHEWVHYLQREGVLSQESTDVLLKLVDKPPEWVKD